MSYFFRAVLHFLFIAGPFMLFIAFPLDLYNHLKRSKLDKEQK